MWWTRALLQEYFDTLDYHASHPEPNGILVAAETGSVQDYLNKERAVLLRCAPEWHIVDDPDKASVFIYYKLTRKRLTYVSDASPILSYGPLW